MPLKYAVLTGAVLFVGLFLTLMLTSRKKPLEALRFEAGRIFTDNKNIIGDSTMEERLKAAGYTFTDLNPKMGVSTLSDSPDSLPAAECLEAWCQRWEKELGAGSGDAEQVRPLTLKESLTAFPLGTQTFPLDTHLSPLRGGPIETHREAFACDGMLLTDRDGTTSCLRDKDVPQGGLTPQREEPQGIYKCSTDCTCGTKDGMQVIVECSGKPMLPLKDEEIQDGTVTVPTSEQEQTRLLVILLDEQRRLTDLIRQLLEAQHPQPQRQEQAP